MSAAPQTLPLEARSLTERLEWAYKTHGDAFAIASSFGAEDIVLLHHAAAVSKSIRVFTLDTGRLHEQTYEVMNRVRDRYGLNIEVYFPKSSAVEELMKAKGAFSFYDSLADRKECCAVRKLEPLSRALEGVKLWATGLRRDQNVTRSGTELLAPDTLHEGKEKLNPLFDWDKDAIWSFIKEHRLPYNKLHDEGFASIGCAPCTRAISADEDERAGRWWWEDATSKECGLHKLPVVKK